MALNIFSCQKYTELDSKKSHEKLSFFENLMHKFHHRICLVCRRYSRQTSLIEQTSKCLIKEEKLSAEAKARIYNKLTSK